MNLRANRALLLVLAAVALVAAFANLGRTLAHPDEGRYAEIAREMATTGDWLTPRLNGVKYFEKPPLQYWATAAAFNAFGVNEASARLYVALCGLATLLLLGYTGARVGGWDAGAATMLALASSPYFVGLAGVITLDMGLTWWTTAALCAFIVAESTDDPRARLRWMMFAWAATACAVLSKGLVGVVLPAAAVFLHCLARRDWSLVGRLEWGYGLVVFFAVAAPWFVAVSYANPEFARFFFVHEHFERFLSTSHRREEPAWYFLPILALGFLPWMLALPAAMQHAWRVEARNSGARPLRLCVAYAVFVLAFFSLSGSKLPAYILPAFPPLALVLGRYLAEAPVRRLLPAAFATPILALSLAGLAWYAREAASDAWMRELHARAMPWLLAGAGALFVAGLATAAFLRRGRRWAALAAAALGSVALVGAWQQAYERYSPRQSGHDVAVKMRPLLAAGARAYSVGTYDQTIPFYIGRTVILVAYADEFETGLRIEPRRAIARLEDFSAHWGRPGEAVAIMHPDIYEPLRAQGLPMQVLHSDPRRILVRKP